MSKHNLANRATLTENIQLSLLRISDAYALKIEKLCLCISIFSIFCLISVYKSKCRFLISHLAPPKLGYVSEKQNEFIQFCFSETQPNLGGAKWCKLSEKQNEFIQFCFSETQPNLGGAKWCKLGEQHT